MSHLRRSHLPLLLATLAPVALFALAARVSARTSPAFDPGPSPHAEGWRTTILEENDSLYFRSDKHYTQGLRLSFLSPVLAPSDQMNGVFDFFAKMPTVFAASPAARRRVVWLFGQSIFTPKNLDIKPPDRHDRPYAGWLYIGSSLLEVNGNRLQNLELDLGVVGPFALGRQVQNDWHQFIGIHQAQGWSGQIQNEPGFVLTYERLWRMRAPLLHWENGGVQSGVDVVPQIGGTIGNVFDYAQAGAELRIGRHLEADFGPVRVRPALSGTDYFDPAHLDEQLGYYFYAGVGGRVVAHDIFLDGNSFRQSPHVEHKTLVADLQAGFSVFWSDRIRLNFSAVRRTDQFVGQRAPDVIGTAGLSFSW